MNSFKKALVSALVFVLLTGLCTGFAYADGSKTGTTTGDAVNLRESPNTSSKVLAKLEKGVQVSVIGSSDGWYNVKYSNLTGWVSAPFISIKPVAVFGNAKITADKVNVRKSASTSAEVVARLDEGVRVNAIGRTGDWYSIKTSGGASGWVYKDFILARDSNASRGDEDLAPANQTVIQGMVDYAKKFLGVKYVYGGTSPSGFDCSGFVLHVFSHFGINLERVAADQAKQGVSIKRADLKPGDAVFFDTDGGKKYICHVGIYIGNGNFIHASSGRNSHKVVISSLNDVFYSNSYITARRFTK